MARKPKGHAHNDERWLLTYADMITLLFVLFIVLFAISAVDKHKFELLKQTLASAFSNGILDRGSSVLPEARRERPAPITESPPNLTIDLRPPSGASLADAAPEQALESRQLEEARRKVERAADAAGLRDRIEAVVDERGLAIRLLTDGVLFDSGSAVLRPEGLRLLDPIVAAVRGLPNYVRIEGHTDSHPIHTSRFPNNRHLGAARALAVEDYLVARGIPDKRIMSASFGAENPIATNATAAGRRRNRRVEILVLRQQGAPQRTARTVLGG